MFILLPSVQKLSCRLWMDIEPAFEKSKTELEDRKDYGYYTIPTEVIYKYDKNFLSFFPDFKILWK